jgi:hypothetical protein
MWACRKRGPFGSNAAFAIGTSDAEPSFCASTTGGKVRYRGLKKNPEWLLAAFVLVNLYQRHKRLVPLEA